LEEATDLMVNRKERQKGKKVEGERRQRRK
jgi:hypothetical protein